MSTTSRPQIKPKQKGKDDLALLGAAAFGGLGIDQLGRSALNQALQDETSRNAANGLFDAVRDTAGTIGTFGTALFAGHAILTGADLRSDFQRFNRVKAAQGSAEAAAKTGAEATAKAGSEAAAKSASRTAVEESVEMAARNAPTSLLGRIGNASMSLLKLGGKRIPVLGAVITGGFVAAEVHGHAMRGDFDLARAAATAGAAEMGGNFFGFGFGDTLREATRGAIIQTGGERFEQIHKSDLRYLGEEGLRRGKDLYNQFTSAHDNTSAPQVTRGAAPQLNGPAPAAGMA